MKKAKAIPKGKFFLRIIKKYLKHGPSNLVS
jgi:hypothetical protein